MVKRTKSSQVGEGAEIFVQEIFNRANWVCNKLNKDFGIDFHVKVFESEHATPWEFYVQVKGTERPHVSKGHIHLALDTEHLKDWYESPLPVLIVVVVYDDVQSKEAYWLWIKEYLEKLDEKYSNEFIKVDLCYLEFIKESLEMEGKYSDELESQIAQAMKRLEDLDWQAQSKITLRIPIGNQLMPEILPKLFADLKRRTLMRNALKVIRPLEEPSSPYYRPLPELDQSIEKPALARCILCGNYFWIEESTAISWEFSKIYEPSPHEPPVYDCEVPEEFCPVCTSGKGKLEQCKNCGRYAVYNNPDYEDEDWDDPLVSQDEARQLCDECLEELRKLRERESKGGNSI